jgi:hypothetical protein
MPPVLYNKFQINIGQMTIITWKIAFFELAQGQAEKYETVRFSACCRSFLRGRRLVHYAQARRHIYQCTSPEK